MKALLIFFVFLAKEPLKIEIIHTSNIYGNFGQSKATWINPDFPPTLGGYGSLAELVRSERENAKKNNHLLLLMDAGNFTGGYVTGDNLQPDSIAYYMNSLGYDFLNLGVKELTLFPVKQRALDLLPNPMPLANYLSKFTAKFISSNIDFLENQEIYAPLISRYEIIDYSGIKIGIFGMISENAPFFIYQDITYQPSPNPFKIHREYESAKKIVDELKSAGCDIIIMLSSIGNYRERFIARDVPGIDLILGGFDGFGERQAYVDPVNHTIILRNYDYMSQVGKINLYVDPDVKTIVNFEYSAITLFEEEFTPLEPAEESETEG